MNSEIGVASAHTTTYCLELISPIVFIAVSGRSNGLGPVISGNTDFPVINCPLGSKEDLRYWSSLNVALGLCCSTIVNPETAAIFPAQLISFTNYFVWCRLRPENGIQLVKDGYRTQK